MVKTTYTRRSVLQAASLIAAFLATPNITGLHAKRVSSFADIQFNHNERRTVVIVGAGMSGLTAAYIAAKSGFRVAVYEGDNRYGGRSLTVRPRNQAYRDWWFDKYNPHRLFPEMYVDAYQERIDSPVQSPQLANFHIENWANSNEPVELFLNAGPGRIPSNHSKLLDLCGEIGVPLEPYIFLSGSNLLWSETYKDGKEPVQWREINYSLLGDMAQILAEVVRNSEALRGDITKGEKNAILKLLKQMGDLNSDYKFKGSSTVGYLKEPSGWQTDWAVNEPISAEDILTSGFIGGGDPEQSPGSFLFNPNHILWQPTLMQPVGGMDRIWQQLLLQEIPEGALDYQDANIKAIDFTARDANPELAGKRFVGDLVRLNSPVRSINNHGIRGVRLEVQGAGEVRGDLGIVTVAPALLGGRNRVPTGITTEDGSADSSFAFIPIPEHMKIRSNLPESFKDALAAVEMTPAIKVGFQGRSRFWEEENEIYGGISWTTKLSSQIWYPSEDFNAPTGILTGAYTRGKSGYEYALLSQAERLKQALEGGETLHTNYAGKVYASEGITIAWQFMPGQVAGWAAETYINQCHVYKHITNLPQGQIYFAGDNYSQSPGWIEGAVASADFAVKSIITGLRSTDPNLYPSGSVMSCED